MNRRFFFIAAAALAAIIPAIASAAQETRAETLLRQLRDPDSQKVFVVAHRGDWRNACENSLQAIQNCIDMGVDIVEIDLRMTKDGVLILNHDKDLKRTCAIADKKAAALLKDGGAADISEYTYAEIVKCFCRKDGAGARTPWKITTFKEAMQLAKGKILVNVDKAFLYMDKVQQILDETGTASQAIYKGSAPYPKLRKRCGGLLDKIIYMPIVGDSAKDFGGRIDEFIKEYKPVAFELSYRKENSPMLEKIKEIRAKKIRVWINTLWPHMQAGHSDEYAALDPDAHWGWVIRHGANILQTDRPEAMLKYLRSQGLHE